MKTIKEKKIDYKQKQELDCLDIINISNIAFNAIIEELGEEPLYIVDKNYFTNQYDVIKFLAKDMIITNTDSYKNYINLTIKGIWHTIDDGDVVFRDESKAKKYALKHSMGIYKKDIEEAKQKLENYNTVKIFERLELEKEKLIEDYKKAKSKYNRYNLILKVNECDKILKKSKVFYKKCKKKQKKIKKNIFFRKVKGYK